MGSQFPNFDVDPNFHSQIPDPNSSAPQPLSVSVFIFFITHNATQIFRNPLTEEYHDSSSDPSPLWLCLYINHVEISRLHFYQSPTGAESLIDSFNSQGMLTLELLLHFLRIEYCFSFFFTFCCGIFLIDDSFLEFLFWVIVFSMKIISWLRQSSSLCWLMHVLDQQVLSLIELFC